MKKMAHRGPSAPYVYAGAADQLHTCGQYTSPACNLLSPNFIDCGQAAEQASNFYIRVPSLAKAVWMTFYSFTNYQACDEAMKQKIGRSCKGS